MAVLRRLVAGPLSVQPRTRAPAPPVARDRSHADPRRADHVLLGGAGGVGGRRPCVHWRQAGGRHGRRIGRRGGPDRQQRPPAAGRPQALTEPHDRTGTPCQGPCSRGGNICAQVRTPRVQRLSYPSYASSADQRLARLRRSQGPVMMITASMRRTALLAVPVLLVGGCWLLDGNRGAAGCGARSRDGDAVLRGGPCADVPGGLDPCRTATAPDRLRVRPSRPPAARGDAGSRRRPLAGSRCVGRGGHRVHSGVDRLPRGAAPRVPSADAGRRASSSPSAAGAVR